MQTRNQFGFSKPDEVFNFATKGAGKMIPEKDRKTERQKDIKTKRQKHRKTERQKDKKTKRQKDKKTKR